jgi:MFS family permease
VAVTASFFVLRETYHPILLERKAKRLREETGNQLYQSRLKQAGTTAEIFVQAIARPSKMFIFSPLVMSMCIYIAVIYGLLYILFTTFTFVYRDVYSFNSIGAGLSFIPGGIGNFIGVAIVGPLSDRLIRKQMAQGLEPQPEQRIHVFITLPSALAIPIGLVVYGWTADKGVHWIAPMIGVAILGFGMMGIFMSVQTYLIDSYTAHAASVTAANAVLRSILGALLPLCGLQLYEAIGLGWGNTLLAFIALFFAPVPWIFFRYGKRIRTSTKLRKEF